MKRYAEVLGCRENRAHVRIYKEKNGEFYPTSVVVCATDDIGTAVGNTAEVEINMSLYYLTTLLGYLLPFLTTAAAFFIVAPFTDNIFIIEGAILITLLLTFICVRYLSRVPFFKSFTFCTITAVEDEEE